PPGKGGVKQYFNPLSPCGERQGHKFSQFVGTLFQPTLPVWGETFLNCQNKCGYWISTHSPRVGRDSPIPMHCPATSNFNPLSPCGERQADVSTTVAAIQFQPTLPVWGETRGKEYLRNLYKNFNPLSPCGE